MNSSPSSALPRESFHDMGTPTECIEDYRMGHYHPVHIGDTFGSYRVLRKLGYGGFATVWLARDESQDRYVALKILRAYHSTLKNRELTVVQRLQQHSTKHEHIVELLDHFWHEGPNGRHLCLIFEPMGPSAMTMASELPCNQPCQPGTVQRLPVWMAKRVLWLVLQGLTFLHGLGVTHGDIQPGNLLFCVQNGLDKVLVGELRQGREKGEVWVPVRRKDGKKDERAPEYLALNQSLLSYADIEPGFGLKISDFGEAFFSAEPPTETPNTPFILRAPELLLPVPSCPLTTKIDIWSFSCLVFELLTGFPLFTEPVFEAHPEALDDLLLQMIEALGPLPDEIFKRWERCWQYFSPDREQKRRDVVRPAQGEENDDPDDEEENDDSDDEEENDDSDDEEELADGTRPPPTSQASPTQWYSPELEEDRPPQTIETYFTKMKHPDIDDDEADMILDLLRSILKYEPEKRPSAAEILEHPWLRGT